MEQIGSIRRRVRRGRASYYLDFRPHGRVYSHRGVPIESRRQAERILRRIRSRLAEGADLAAVLAEFSGTGSRPSGVSTWLDRWLDHQQVQAEHGQISPTYLAALRSYARAGGPFDFWRGRPLQDLRKSILAEWRDQLLRTRSPKYVQNILGGFRSFVRWLTEDVEVLKHHVPFPSVRLGAEYVPNIIGPDVQAAVLDAIPYEERGAFLALSLGLRPGDVRALNVADYRDGWLTLRKATQGQAASAPTGPTKTRRSRRVPVGEELAEWLAWRLRGESDLSAPLFRHPRARNPERRWSGNELRKTWRAAADEVGVRVGLYEGLKHSTATALLAEGVPEHVLQKLLGHRERKSTRRYAQLADQALVDAVGRVRRRTPDQGNGSPAGAGLVSRLSPAPSRGKSPPTKVI